MNARFADFLIKYRLPCALLGAFLSLLCLFLAHDIRVDGTLTGVPLETS